MHMIRTAESSNTVYHILIRLIRWRSYLLRYLLRPRVVLFVTPVMFGIWLVFGSMECLAISTPNKVRGTLAGFLGESYMFGIQFSAAN